jgi:hypothetical protein
MPRTRTLTLDHEPARFVAGAVDPDGDRVRREQTRQPFRPLDDGDPIGPERLFETEVSGVGRILDAEEVEVLDRGRSVIPLAEDECRTRDGYITAMQRANEGADEGGFTGAEFAGERQRVARAEGRGEPSSSRSERILVEKIEDVRGHALPFDERIRVLVRASDVVVGIIAGAVCAVLSAAYEGGILALRFFSIDHLGGHFGNGFAILALAGAAIGGVVALGAGTLFRREPVTP